MTVSTTKPLEDAERRILLDSFVRFDSLDSLTTHWFYSTACHPWSLANEKRANWKIVSEDGFDYFVYIRCKIYTQVRIPIDPAIRPWAEDFLANELGWSEREYLRRVNRYGKLIGLPGLSPRSLRHDCIFRFGRAAKWDLNALQAMFGTDVKILLNYAASDRARVYSPTFVANGFS